LKLFSFFLIFFKKTLDRRFLVVLKLSTASDEKQNFLGDISMSQNWIHTNQITICPAAYGMRFGRSLSAGLCVNFENSEYQPKQGGLDRLGRKI
jgi:hypothetical protein